MDVKLSSWLQICILTCTEMLRCAGCCLCHLTPCLLYFTAWAYAQVQLRRIKARSVVALVPTWVIDALHAAEATAGSTSASGASQRAFCSSRSCRQQYQLVPSAAAVQVRRRQACMVLHNCQGSASEQERQVQKQLQAPTVEPARAQHLWTPRLVASSFRQQQWMRRVQWVAQACVVQPCLWRTRPQLLTPALTFMSSTQATKMTALRQQCRAQVSKQGQASPALVTYAAAAAPNSSCCWVKTTVPETCMWWCASAIAHVLMFMHLQWPLNSARCSCICNGSGVWGATSGCGARGAAQAAGTGRALQTTRVMAALRAT